MRKKMYCFLVSFAIVGTIGCATEATNPTITPTSIVEVEKKDTKATVTPTVTTEEKDKKLTPTNAEAESTTKTPTPTKASSSAFVTKEPKKKETIING